MKNYYFTFILLLASLTSSGQNDFTKFLERVKSLPQSNKQSVCDSFYNVSKTIGLPRVLGDTAYFIYKGNASTVNFVYDVTLWDSESIPLSKIKGTNFFYLAIWFEQDARIEYKFVTNGTNWIMDPGNSETGRGGMGTNSVLTMPDYDYPSEIIERNDIDKGTLERIKIHSSILNRDYTVNVYLPYDYHSNKYEYPTVYFQDGSDYLNYASAKNVLDNIIYDKISSPVIAVFITPTNRVEEYVFSEANDYCRVFGEEIVPYIDERYNTIAEREKRLVIGDSDGAGISAYISEKYNDLFENVGLQSIVAGTGNYFVYNVREFTNIKIHYTWGEYEYTPWSENQEIYKNDLVAQGHDIVWNSYPEGHNFGFWGAYLDDLISHFFPEGSIKDKGETTSLHNYSKLDAKTSFYPNPFYEDVALNVEANETGVAELKLFNVNSQMLRHENFKILPGKNLLRLNLSDIPKGNYYVKIKIGDKYKTIKVVKK